MTLLVSINFHSSSAEVRQWSKHSRNSCWSKLVDGHDTFAIDGDIAKKVGSLYRDETGGLVVLHHFSKLEGKKTLCHRKGLRWMCRVWGEALLCMFLEIWICVLLPIGLLLHWWTKSPNFIYFFWRFGLLLHWHTGDGLALVHWTSHLLRCHLTQESGNRTRTSMSFREVFPKRKPYIQKIAINIHYTHIIILQIINKHILYIHVYVNITTWLFFHRSKFPPMPALPVTWAW